MGQVMTHYVIDSNIIMYYLNNAMSETIADKMTEIFKTDFTISVITKMELLGYRNHTEISYERTRQFAIV